jgi:predicted amidohydrolase
MYTDGVDFLVLPEMFNCKYTPDVLEAREDTDRVVRGLTDLSLEHSDLYIVGGTLPLRDESDGTAMNRALTFRNGSVVHTASKIHLFKPINDHKRFKAGEYASPFVARVRGENVRVGVLICFDLRFPEIARRMAEEGLDILFVPAHWPAERDLPWRTLLAARAIENQMFTVGVNGDGKSYCFSPSGKCRYQSVGIIDLASFRIDLGEISDAKKLIDTTEGIDL